MKRRKEGDVVSSFNSAFRGLIYVLKVERNFRIHIGFAVAVIIGSLFWGLPLTEFLILILVVTLVLIAEITNTLIEMFVDTFVQEYTINAKRIKDVGASLVLIATCSACIIGYLVLAKHFPQGWRSSFENIANSPWYITFIILLLVLSITILLKVILKKEALLSGGMPSIHSGLSFSIWTIVSFLTFKEYPLVSLLVFLLAFWVAQSRILRKIHTIEEVTIGGFVGILITVTVFQIFIRFT